MGLLFRIDESEPTRYILEDDPTIVIKTSLSSPEAVSITVYICFKFQTNETWDAPYRRDKRMSLKELMRQFWNKENFVSHYRKKDDSECLPPLDRMVRRSEYDETVQFLLPVVLSIKDRDEKKLVVHRLFRKTVCEHNEPSLKVIFNFKQARHILLFPVMFTSCFCCNVHSLYYLAIYIVKLTHFCTYTLKCFFFISGN